MYSTFKYFDEELLWLEDDMLELLSLEDDILELDFEDELDLPSITAPT
jgi:hypothetical protein